MVGAGTAWCHQPAGCSMSRFSPTTCYLRDRLRRTSYEDIDEFKQLLMLERLIVLSVRGEIEEALFVGLRDRFPDEAEVLILEFRSGLIAPDPTAVRSRSNSELLKLREQRRQQRRDYYRRERTDWFVAGGQP